MGFAVTSYQDGPVGILSASIISLDQSLNTPDNETALQTDKDRYEMFKNPAATIDKKALDDFVDPINSKKATVVTNGQFSVWQANEFSYATQGEAENALDHLYGDPDNTDGLYSKKQVISIITWTGSPGSPGNGLPPTDPGYIGPTGPSPSATITVSAGAAVTQTGQGSGVALIDTTITAGTSGRIIVEQVSGGFVSGSDELWLGPFGGTQSVVSSVAGVNFIAEGEIYDDVVVAHFYPNMEPPDPGQEDIFANPVTKIITSSNLGLGIGNTFYRNGLSTTASQPNPVLGDFVDTDTGVPLKGKVYTFDISASESTTVINNKQEIQTLRIGTGSPQTSAPEFANAAGVVKEQKQSYAINVWSGERMKVVMNNDKSSFETAIAVLTNPGFQ